MSTLQIAHAEPDYLLLRWRSIFIPIFRGPVLARHLEIARPIAYEAIREATDGGALLSIFAPTASEQGAESRALAAELVEDAGRVVRAVATVYEGKGPQVSALLDRTRDVITRAGTSAPVGNFDSLPKAAKWVLETSKLIADPGEPERLVRAIEEARAKY